MYKADANESPYGLPKEQMERLFAKIEKAGLMQYPENHDNVKKALANYTGLSAEYFICGNGSDELIAMTILALAKGGKVVICAPTFGMYAECAKNYGCEVAILQCDENLQLDIKVYTAFAKSEKANVVVLCNPNNPTGQKLQREEVEQFIKEVGCTVILDEAYSEFSGVSCIDLVRKYPDLIVLRTLSKAFGVAGIRFGYLAAAKELKEKIEAYRPIYNLGIMPLLAAETALEDTRYMEEAKSKITAERVRLEVAFVKLQKVKPLKSAANFILIRCDNGEKLAYEMTAAGVTPRTYGDEVLKGCVRVTIGTPAQNDIILKVLEAYDAKS